MLSKYTKNHLVNILYRHIAALVCAGIVTLILLLFQPFLEIQLIALLFLVPVMLSTVLWGLIPGVLAAMTAFLAFNFYFIQPYHTFAVHKTLDLITLIIFLVVAVLISQLIGQTRRGMQLARSREWEATRMYELISALSGLQDSNSIAQTLAAHTLETFRIDRVDINIAAREEKPAIRVSVPAGATIDGAATIHTFLETARGKEDEMFLWDKQSRLSSEELRLLSAYCSQGALSLERIHLAKSENKAKLLEESDQLKSSLLNSVSHELRSPLSVIKASVSSLRSGAVSWNSADRLELLATIEEESDHLNTLVGNLLDMSRIEAGALYPQIRWNAIAEIVTGVVVKMRKQLQNHHLEINLPENLPLVPTDYVMMEQVFTNLISNSVKYAPPDSQIRVAAAVEDSFIHIQVSNESPSIPDEHLDRIFEKFYRVTEADRITGTGLGLSICKGIVEAHGGKIWAENQPCCFVFHLVLPLLLNGVSPVVPQDEGDE
jgi:two-component system sensor histidine kinase KdpD